MADEALDLADFTIIKRIGTGARSAIYMANDEIDKTTVALKRVVYEKPEDLRIFEQVETEYKISRLVDHPYVRKCFKIQKIRKMLRIKEMLLSMELFEGNTLENTPTLSLVDVLLVFRMVATGLNAMHEKGVIHCDIKPNNILINNAGSIRIIDLGQSCKIGTRKTRIQGTPDYIAPEQVRRQPLDPQTDIFNLGATMYWAFTGKNVPTLIPKKNESLTDLTPQTVLSPHEFKKQIPIGISNLVMDCVKDNPRLRPNGMSAIISRLDLLIHSILGDKLTTIKNASKNS